MESVVSCNVESIAQSLNSIERKVLRHITKQAYLEDVASLTGLQEIEVMRGFQWLQNKDLARMSDEVHELVVLAKNGERIRKQGFPEKKFLEAVENGKKTLSQLQKCLEPKEINVCIGILKRESLISVKKEKELVFSITDNGRNRLKSGFSYEQFIQKDFPVKVESLSDDEKKVADILTKRNIVEKRLVKRRKALITAQGLKVLELIKKEKKEAPLTEKLTSDMLKDSSWKGRAFRRYDVESEVPRIHGGKRHFVNQAVEYIRSIWLELGFKEMRGPLVQTSFWNFDALFTAQDHPVREMQDTFFVRSPGYGKLPDERIVARVKEAHERGTKGSTGWGGTWDERQAKRNVMRTHTTVLSSQTLAKLKKEDLPAKYFAVGRCFRNETLDWKHLFEFNQVEGIVVDPDANLKHLKGYLTQFYNKMGFPEVRMRPAFFPYTEMSMEVDVFHPFKKEWVELGGAGIFRPEVVEPLMGEDIPVLAWGQGMGRIISEYWKITDIRELYKNDIKHLREMKLWLR